MAPKTILDESEAEWAKDFRYAIRRTAPSARNNGLAQQS
jgi:hypothetical protein